MNFEKDLEWSVYLDVYGEFLTDKQQKVMKAYYDEDFSLAEIAEEMNISRQGVRDTINRAQLKLTDMESKLHLVHRA